MNQIPLPDSARADDPEADEVRDDKTRQIATDVAYRQIAIVNVIFSGPPDAGDGQWVLIDAGLTGSASAIRTAAQARFGQTGRPSAIILTHGHFDHVGSLETLAAEWDVPVYAHRLEHPYLNGTISYPPADPSVGGGAGDAFVTTKQESVYAAVTQAPEMHGPPMYFTPDWPSARQSVLNLAALGPETVVTGHGQAMQGAGMRSALKQLAERFEDIAIPKHGRYVL
jgi:hypothetical protein